ncbi:MAG: LysR family transcriptional regulator [Deltaproteobacteria bacterium]|nr:LysR family transcriptional regulator [Deltaproteobacteria bacterium]
MFDFRKIEAFCRVYEQRSFSKAGEVLFLSQPTVSAHVQALENEVGVRLLDRLGRTVLPTPAGAALYRHSIKAFEELEAAKNEISRLMGEVAGEVLLGCSTIPAGFLLPDIVTGFIRKHPKASMNLTVKDSHSIIKAVLDCEVMLGVVGAVEAHPDLEYIHLVDDELVLVCSPQLALKHGREEVSGAKAAECLFSLEDALAWPWILRNEGSGTRRGFEEGMLQAGCNARDLRAELKVDGTQAAVQYARAGLGVTVTSGLVVAEQLAKGELIEVRIDKLRLPRKFYAVQNLRRCLLFPAQAAFISYMAEQTVNLRHPE